MKFFATPKYSVAILINISVILLSMYTLLASLNGSRTLSSAIRNDDSNKYYDDEKLADITTQYKAYQSAFKMSYSFALISSFSLAFLLKKNCDALPTQPIAENRPSINRSSRPR